MNLIKRYEFHLCALPSSHPNPIVGKQIILMAHLKPSIFKEFNFPLFIQQYSSITFFLKFSCKEAHLNISPPRVLQIRPFLIKQDCLIKRFSSEFCIGFMWSVRSWKLSGRILRFIDPTIFNCAINLTDKIMRWS